MMSVPSVMGYSQVHLQEYLIGAQLSIVQFLQIFSGEQLKNKAGGFFCMVPVRTGENTVRTPILIAELGMPDREKRQKYFSYCQEKAARLAAHPGHLTSWESRDPDAEQWGGAIRGRKYIFSFSGFPEMLDEIFSIAVAHELELLEDNTAQGIAGITQNQYFDQWLQRWQRMLPRPQ